MRTILFLTIFLLFNLNISVYSSEEKCGTFDIGRKTKKFVKDTKDFQKKGLDKSKKQLGKNKDKLLKVKDKVVEDVKDTADGVSEGIKSGVGNVKKEIKK